MKITEQLAEIKSALDELAKSNGGEVQICSDPSDTFQRLLSGPNKVRIYVNFEGQSNAGSGPGQGRKRMVKRTFLVVLSRGRGLDLILSTNLVLGQAGGSPLFDLVEEAVGLLWDTPFAEAVAGTMEAEITAQDIQVATWRHNQGLPMDALEISFYLATRMTSTAGTIAA